MAGGATYSESRSCYEISNQTSRDVVLLTSHMISPGLWMRQLGDLSVERRRLGIPADLPPKKAHAHLFEKEPEPRPPAAAKSPPPGAGSIAPQAAPVPPTKQMQAVNLNGYSPANSRPGSSVGSGGVIKLGDSGKDKKEKKEKKHHFHFGSSKK